MLMRNLCLQCPTFKREADGSETLEPFAAEAKFFTESRLLQRDVQIILESCPNQIILGTILHPVWSHIRSVFWLISLITAVELELNPFELFECTSYFVFRLDQFSWSKILVFEMDFLKSLCVVFFFSHKPQWLSKRSTSGTGSTPVLIPQQK